MLETFVLHRYTHIHTHLHAHTHTKNWELLYHKSEHKPSDGALVGIQLGPLCPNGVYCQLWKVCQLNCTIEPKSLQMPWVMSWVTFSCQSTALDTNCPRRTIRPRVQLTRLPHFTSKKTGEQYNWATFLHPSQKPNFGHTPNFMAELRVDLRTSQHHSQKPSAQWLCSSPHKMSTTHVYLSLFFNKEKLVVLSFIYLISPAWDKGIKNWVVLSPVLGSPLPTGIPG